MWPAWFVTRFAMASLKPEYAGLGMEPLGRERHRSVRVNLGGGKWAGEVRNDQNGEANPRLI